MTFWFCEAHFWLYIIFNQSKSSSAKQRKCGKNYPGILLWIACTYPYILYIKNLLYLTCLWDHVQTVCTFCTSILILKGRTRNQGGKYFSPTLTGRRCGGSVWREVRVTLKVHKHEIILIFLPKSKPYKALVNFWKKKIDSSPLIFARILMFEHLLGDWAYAELYNFFFAKCSLWSY